MYCCQPEIFAVGPYFQKTKKPGYKSTSATIYSRLAEIPDYPASLGVILLDKRDLIEIKLIAQ